MPGVPARLGVLIATWLLVCGCVSRQTFNSPDEAADALVRALREDNSQQLKQILGNNANDLLYSGDEVADENAVERFLSAYDKKHRLVTDGEDYVTIVVGDDDWPLPIPISRAKNQTWSFDTEAGKDEIINRRIGANELDVIEVCKAIVDAQQEYATLDTDGDGVSEYAQKFLSDPNTKNGLYWDAGEGQPSSPLGPLVAAAVAEGYEPPDDPGDQPQPYHGYCYRMLKSQGPHAPGGAMDYVIKGKMIGGFAVVAFPADYDNSGITTFLVSQDGVVYQKDLGPGTTRIARSMRSFDPGEGWSKVEAAPATENAAGSR